VVAEIVPIGVPNLADIPAMLERLAAMIRGGEVECPTEVVVVAKIPNDVRGFNYGGDGSTISVIGILGAGSFHVAHNSYGR